MIKDEDVKKAEEIFRRYKNGKANLDKRIVEEEQFWKRRHWEMIKAGEKEAHIPPTSGWMFNSIANKHADAMDSYPEIKCLPREASDKESADTLTAIIPVVLERNNFEETYSDNWWYKLKHGCSAYGVFWDNSLGELGDVAIKRVDLLNIFWEPGITKLSESENLFIVNLVSTEALAKSFPKVKLVGGDTNEVKKYIYDDHVDTTDKSVVIDWYYRKYTSEGKRVLHLCKFTEGKVLFASENEKAYKETGWYEDGEYPIVLDVLYPTEGTPAGFGVISVTKESQLYIDKLDDAVMKNAMMKTNPRFFARNQSGVNEEEFLDWSKPIVHVEGDLEERNVRAINIDSVPGYVHNFRDEKINELKETSSNRDFSQGSTAGGVTSGAAIAVLQEAGNKTSRDMINASYRAYSLIAEKIIERMRQFYTEERAFRITGETPGEEYAQFSNAEIVPQLTGSIGGTDYFRKPVFDIRVKAQKRSPFSTLSQNETAMNLYKMGFFAPERAQQSLAALKIMDFEGKQDVEEAIIQMAQMYQMQQEQIQQMQNMGIKQEM